MARSDLLLSIVRAGTEGDQSTLRAAVEALAAEEKAKNHRTLADRLTNIINSVTVSGTLSPRQPTSPGSDIVLESRPQRQLEELILPLPVVHQIKNVVEEQERASLLRAHGMQPRNRILLSGPPGNGKTSVAEAIAERLALPLFTVRYDALVGSFLGETNTRLRRLFDYARTTSCVLFFDEFDSIGKERGDSHETGEIKRVVSFLLMQIDQLPSYVVTVAATNHHELLDRAVWRRFQLQLNLPAPSWQELAALVERQFEAWPERVALSPEQVAKKLRPASFAEAVEFCQTVRRRHILSLGATRLDEILKDEIDLWASRVGRGSDGTRSTTTATKARPTRRVSTSPRSRER